MASKTTDPKSNKEVAQAVITPKRKYFLPIEGVTVEAEDMTEAAAKAKKAREVGDGNI